MFELQLVPVWTWGCIIHLILLITHEWTELATTIQIKIPANTTLSGAHGWWRGRDSIHHRKDPGFVPLDSPGIPTRTICFVCSWEPGLSCCPCLCTTDSYNLMMINSWEFAVTHLWPSSNNSNIIPRNQCVKCYQIGDALQSVATTSRCH